MLPADVWVQAEPGGTPVDPTTVLGPTQLADWNGIAPDTDTQRWKHLESHEMAIARWLTERGVGVRSVREFKKRSPPDVVTISRTPVAIEFKTLSPADGYTYSHLQCLQNVKDAAMKCRRVIVDLRSTNVAVSAAKRTLLDAVTGNGINLDELVFIAGVAPGRPPIALGWRRG